MEPKLREYEQSLPVNLHFSEPNEDVLEKIFSSILPPKYGSRNESYEMYHLECALIETLQNITEHANFYGDKEVSFSRFSSKRSGRNFINYCIIDSASPFLTTNELSRVAQKLRQGSIDCLPNYALRGNGLRQSVYAITSNHEKFTIKSGNIEINAKKTQDEIRVQITECDFFDGNLFVWRKLNGYFNASSGCS